MKKFLVVFIGLVLIAPVAVLADPTQYVDPLTATEQNPATTSANSPKYQSVTVSSNDENHIASTAYIKGAYNSAIAAVNKVYGVKQDTLYTDSNNPSSAGTVRQSVASGTSGAVVTGVTASDGIVTVTRGEITIPSGSASSSTRAQIWIQ